MVSARIGKPCCPCAARGAVVFSSKAKLTDAVVARAALPGGKREGVIWDTEVTGFGLRLRGATKTYVVSYRPAGAGRSATMRRLKLGTPDTIPTASEARRIARTALGKVAAGADPAAERAEAKRRAKARICDLLDRYEADLQRRRYVARAMVVSVLRRRLKPHLAKDIAELRGTDYAAIVEKLERAGMPGAAEAFRSRCRAFLTWCVVKAKVLDANPLFGHRKERATRADRLARGRHGRALSDDEIAAVWRAADPGTTFGRFVRYLILTGCRRGEGAGLSRTMLDPEGGAIHLPPQFVKQGRGHLVPITPPLSEVLAACPHDARSDLFFPSSRTGGPMSGWNKLTAGIVKRSGVQFSFHDLRRTFRTGLSRLGVDGDTAERALGHARENLVEIYDRSEGVEALRDAFGRWARHVQAITSPSAVPIAAE